MSDSCRKRAIGRVAWAALLVSLCAAGAVLLHPAEGITALKLEKMLWRERKLMLKLKGSGAGERETLVVRDADTGRVLGETVSDRSGQFRFRKQVGESAPCRIEVAANGGETVVGDYTHGRPGTCDDERDARHPANLDPVRRITMAAPSHADRFPVFEGTRTCLGCHEGEAYEVHESLHYQWRGDAWESVGLSDAVAGKMGGINDFCSFPDINWIGSLTTAHGERVDGGCARCHAGLGMKPDTIATQKQLENIDCLICHSDSYRRRVAPVAGGLRFVPDEEAMDVSLLEAATEVGRPTTGTCLNCHARAGGGDNYKRGDLSNAQRRPSRYLDVHLAGRRAGGVGLTCLDCHSVVNHRFAGRGADLRPRESDEVVNCERCHTRQPHHDEKIDKHTRRVACTVCHIPYYAKTTPTDLFRDWSRPGELVAETGLYEPSHVKGQRVRPVYRFWNGRSRFYEFGASAEAGENGRIAMSAPEGGVEDPDARIFAFKLHRAVLPVDPGTQRILPLKAGLFSENGRIDEAVQAGAEAVGWEYSGHTFAETERFMGLFHEVAPREDALACGDCHGSGSRLDFHRLGYTPDAERNGQPLCAGCHADRSGEWKGAARFSNVHEKHVTDRRLDCGACHGFSGSR